MGRSSKLIIIVSAGVFVFWTMGTFQGLKDEFFPAFNRLQQMEVELRDARSEIRALQEQNDANMKRIEALENARLKRATSH